MKLYKRDPRMLVPNAHAVWSIPDDKIKTRGRDQTLMCLHDKTACPCGGVIKYLWSTSWRLVASAYRRSIPVPNESSCETNIEHTISIYRSRNMRGAGWEADVGPTAWSIAFRWVEDGEVPVSAIRQFESILTAGKCAYVGASFLGHKEIHPVRLFSRIEGQSVKEVRRSVIDPGTN